VASDERIIRVRLLANEIAGLFFLSDICSMLFARVRRSSADNQLQLGPRGGFDLRATASEPICQALGEEIGLHRAQFVPKESVVGRVETVLVAVELLSPEDASISGRPNAPILRTYNYVLGSVTTHATGESYPLSAVLSGDAG
jgi:hypothetical protein